MSASSASSIVQWVLSDVKSILLAANVAALVRFFLVFSLMNLIFEFTGGNSFIRYSKKINLFTHSVTGFTGSHFVLFGVCMYILNRNKGSIHWFIFTSAFFMFAISTADISITFRLMGHDILLLDGSDLNDEVPLLVQRFYPKNLLFVADKYGSHNFLSVYCIGPHNLISLVAEIILVRFNIYTFADVGLIF